MGLVTDLRGQQVTATQNNSLLHHKLQPLGRETKVTVHLNQWHFQPFHTHKAFYKS